MDDPMPGPAPDRGGDTRQAAAPVPSLWRERDYVGWWSGNTVSALGTSVSAIAFPLLVLFATGSVAKAGAISAANLLGVLVTTLIGGALADRFSRKAILVTGPLVQGGALGAVAVAVKAGHTPIAFLAAAAAVSGLAAGIITGAQTPALRRIVPREQLALATGQAMGRDMAAELLGTPLGGFLFSIARWLPFAGDAVSFAFASLGAAFIRRPLGPDRTAADRAGGIGRDIADGIGFVRREPFLRFTVLWGAALNTVGQAFTLLFIALIRHRGGGPTEIGLISSLALIGGLAGAVVGPAVARKVRARIVMYASAWSFTGALALAAAVPRPWEIGLVLMLGMMAMVPLNIVLQAWLVHVVPDELSGRVAAVGRFGTQGLEWTGPLLAGLLVALFGVPGAVVALAVPTAGLAVALHLTRALRILDRPMSETDGGREGRAAPGRATAVEAS